MTQSMEVYHQFDKRCTKSNFKETSNMQFLSPRSDLLVKLIPTVMLSEEKCKLDIYQRNTRYPLVQRLNEKKRKEAY